MQKTSPQSAETKSPPSDWRKWFIDRKAAGEVATLIGGHPGDRTVSIPPSEPEWEGDTSWPIALGYPWVRWDEPYIGNQPKAADGSIAARDNMAPVEMGKQPKLVAQFPFALKLIGNEYGEMGCAIYVREDVYGDA